LVRHDLYRHRKESPRRRGTARPGDANPLKIGIIGAGKIGGTLATLWVKAGHEVLVSSRHPDELQGLRGRSAQGTRRHAARGSRLRRRGP